MANIDLVFDFSFLLEKGVLGFFISGLITTILVSLLGVLIGIVLGLIIGLIKLLGPKYLRVFATIYITYFRATPLLVQLYIIYYLPSILFKSDINSFLAGVIAIGLNSAAYVAEIFRGGVMAVDKGQFEAGRSLGFSQKQTLIKIIIPQAFKHVLPALGNEFIVIIKETAIISVVALKDIMFYAKQIGNTNYNALPPLLFASFIYLILVMGLTTLLKQVERKLKND